MRAQSGTDAWTVPAYPQGWGYFISNATKIHRTTAPILHTKTRNALLRFGVGEGCKMLQYLGKDEQYLLELAADLVVR